MKKLLLGLLLISGFIAKAQVYNNEWIDYSKTYYKFKVGKTGLYRISQSVLSAAGLGNTPAEYFQLWRNGNQIPIYTSVATGNLSSSDYIEFWGEMNDGRPDKELYRNPNWQLNDKWSLETDTATYFLAVNNNIASNLRLQTTANNVAGTSLSADPYFMYTAGKYFRDRMNPGYAVNVGEFMYSSSYDRGEGWSSGEIVTTFNSSCAGTYGKNSFVFSNLNVYKGASAPAPKFKIAVSGNRVSQRNLFAKVNSDSVLTSPVDFFNYTVDSTTFSLNTLNGSLDTVSVFNYTSLLPSGCVPEDRMVIHKYEITYPRNFNFNGQTSFEFTLAANASGNYLQITNFNYGSSNPVLYDLTNGKRYVADLSAAPVVNFVLQPSLTSRNLVLVNEEPGNINSVTGFQPRNFVDYTNASNQGDYIILTNALLLTGTGNDPVMDYKAYRSSAAGGSYDAKIYLVDEIIDQFGFGIKKNPAGIRNFFRFARNKFDVAPKQVFIIGRGMVYPNQRTFESYPYIDQLNMVPTFGNPASDALLVSEPGSSLPELSIGRLSVIIPSEVAVYLKKVKDFEQAQAMQSPLIKDKAWMKNVAHIVGAGDQTLSDQLSQYMKDYKNIIAGPLYGADVFTFNKTSTDAVSQISDKSLEELMNSGISVMSYFGHSSSTTLQFNIDNPENYSNYGKYPLFLGLGCNVGSFFGYSTVRLQTYKETLSEKYVLAPDRGMIGVVGSTHFGIPYYLDLWATQAYQEMAYKSYAKTIGEILKATVADVFQSNGNSQEDFYARCNAEETLYHGDPAIRLNPHAKPDYVVEDSMVKISPTILSVHDQEFQVDAQFLNIGRSPDSAIVVKTERFRPNETVPSFVRRDTISGIHYSTSISVKIPINAAKDKGLNKLVITVDADNSVDELFENNNSVTKDVIIYEDEASPVYPYNFAIVNTQNIKLIASTANPFALRKQYQMELDTTELFNSPLKMVKTVDSSGGIIEFDPGISFVNNTVYYWRVSPVVTSGSPSWNTSSFIYLSNSEAGFNQSHFYQQSKSEGRDIGLDSSTRKWKFGTRINDLFVKQGSWATSTGQTAGFTVAVNGVVLTALTCYFQSIVFNVFDPVTFQNKLNQTLIPENSPGYPLGLGLYGSHATQCYGQNQSHNFEFRYLDSSTRKKAMDFMQNAIPDGSYVVVRNFTLDPATFTSYGQAFINDWKADEAVYGPGQSLYSYLKNAGLAGIDSFYRARPFALIYKKNDPSFTPRWIMGDGVYDNVTLSADCPTPDTSGNIISPVFGPAKAWKQLQWKGSSMDIQPGDNARLDLIGIKNDGSADTLMSNITPAQQTVDISSVNATTYPFVKLNMHNGDTVNVTPYQLDYWRLTYLPVPEGAVNPGQYFSMTDTVEVGQPLPFKIAFKNVTNTPFGDSMKVKIEVTDRNNVKRTMTIPNKQRILQATPDTLQVGYQIDTRQLTGANTLYVEINPDNDQAEQYHFNNFFYKTFYVRGDTLNPLLDVTFDNVHILNNDIVSAKPSILIKLKDEAKWNLLDDPSKIRVQLHKFGKTLTDPGSVRDYKFDGDTLVFQPANQAPPTNNNTASAIFKPQLEDGNYELIVSATDMSDNSAGPMQYRVAFEVINKPMISNMLNYPNPFTTSTAFVFTLTGSEVPQNIRIQILTVTGKVVREILKDELGPLRIGRNITEFKWDGTDQYGQKLANGVYLYRVITNLNGKSLDKYTSDKDNTDKYFNKGYGKMYLMR